MRLRLFRNATQRLRYAGHEILFHLDSLDHGEVTRASLRAQARAEGIPDAQLLIPADGEAVEI